MINSEIDHDDAALERIAETGARGAVWVAGIASAVVVLLWFAFYLFVFSPRVHG
jgi:hypothetical protein